MNYLTHKVCRRLRGVLTAVALTVCLSLPAQTHYDSNVSVGIKGGIDMSKVFFNPSVKQSFAPGATGGVAIRYIEENHFGLLAEINFSQRGWKEDFEGLPFNYSRTINYVDVPVMAHIYFGRRGRFFFNAGPQVSLFVEESTKSNFNPENISDIPDFPVKNRINFQQTMPVHNKFDYGIAAGLGGEFNIARKHSVFLEARFYYGLGNIFRARRQDPMRASNQMTISVSAGYWFRIK